MEGFLTCSLFVSPTFRKSSFASVCSLVFWCGSLRHVPLKKALVFSGLHFFTSVLQLKAVLDALAGCFRPPYDRSSYFRMMDPCLKDAENG